MATAQKTQPKAEKARFEADGTGLRIIVQRQKEVFGENGMKQAVPGSGKTILFQPNGYGGQFYETADPAEITVLREKAQSADPKFFEVPIPKPPSSDVLRQIVGLTARGDTEALVALARTEEETHQREDVLDAIADALEQAGS